MGELSKQDAERKRDSYKDHFRRMKSRVQEDFEEMDFENADQRNHMESHVNGIVDIIDGLIKELDGMTFS